MTASLRGFPRPRGTARKQGLRTALRTFAALVLVALMGAAFLVWRTFPKTRGTVRARGHAAPVRIETDARGVPTIRASSIPDAIYGLGYVHARDRLWQMEFERRVGSGRLAEVLGEGLVSTDRCLRTVGFRRAAELTESQLSPETRGILEAYAAGVNAFRAEDSARQIEFRILRPGTYTVTFTLEGFTTVVRQDISGSRARRTRTGPRSAACPRFRVPGWSGSD